MQRQRAAFLAFSTRPPFKATGSVRPFADGGPPLPRVPGAEQLVVATVGKMDAKKRIEDSMTRLMSANIVQNLGTMLDTVVF